VDSYATVSSDIAIAGEMTFIVAWDEIPYEPWTNPTYPSIMMMEMSFDGTTEGSLELSPSDEGLGIARVTSIPDGGALVTWGEMDTYVNRSYVKRVQPGYSNEPKQFLKWSDPFSTPSPSNSLAAILSEDRYIIIFQGVLGDYPLYSSSIYVTMHTSLRPDLSFDQDPTVTPLRPMTSQSVHIEYIVKNTGPAIAYDVNVIIYLRDEKGSQTRLDSAQIPLVRPSEEVELEWTWRALTGDNSILFVISGCEPSEDILWNNTMEIHFADINAPPIIQINSPPSLAVLGGEVGVSGSAWDLDWDPLSFQFRIDDGEWIPFDGSMDWSFSFVSNALTDERHSIGVRCWDGKNHSNVDVLEFYVNNAVDDPDQTFLIVDTWPTDTITINTVTEIEFGVTTWTYFNRVITYEWSMNDTEVAADTSTFTLNSSYYANGSYTLTVSCSDGERELEHEWDIMIEVPPADTVPPDDPVNENEPSMFYWAMIAVVVIIVIGSLSFYIWKRNST